MNEFDQYVMDLVEKNEGQFPIKEYWNPDFIFDDRFLTEEGNVPNSMFTVEQESQIFHTFMEKYPNGFPSYFQTLSNMDVREILNISLDEKQDISYIYHIGYQWKQITNGYRGAFAERHLFDIPWVDRYLQRKRKGHRYIHLSTNDQKRVFEYYLAKRNRIPLLRDIVPYGQLSLILNRIISPIYYYPIGRIWNQCKQGTIVNNLYSEHLCKFPLLLRDYEMSQSKRSCNARINWSMIHEFQIFKGFVEMHHGRYPKKNDVVNYEELCKMGLPLPSNISPLYCYKIGSIWKDIKRGRVRKALYENYLQYIDILREDYTGYVLRQ